MTGTLGIKCYSIRHIYAIAAIINYIIRPIVSFSNLMNINILLGITALAINEPIDNKHINASINRKLSQMALVLVFIKVSLRI